MPLIKSKKRKVGIALNPKTLVKKVVSYLNSVDMILVMTVNPGKYGSKFLPSMLKKVEELRRLKPSLNLEVDGGISDKTINFTIKARANSFVVGSYLQKSKNVKKDSERLRKRIG